MRPHEISSRRRRSALWAVSLAYLVGCDAPPLDEEVDTQRVSEQPLLGTGVTLDCTAEQRQQLLHSLAAGRFLAVSKGFSDCVDRTMRSGARLSAGGVFSQYPPYVPQAVDGFTDPFFASSIDVQVDSARYATGSTTNLELDCEHQPAGNPHVAAMAAAGPWLENRYESETMLIFPKLFAAAGADNLRTGSTADFFQRARAISSGVMWHEAAHQWGYVHATGAASADELHSTIPYHVGACMETMMGHASACTKTCPSGMRPAPIATWAPWSCDCVDDPQFDVGVILAGGQVCPALSGRAKARAVALTMDDENNQNANARGGFIGNFISNSQSTTFRFCALPGLAFKPSTSANYAVARMGTTCPPGSVSMSRYFDNEDTANANSTSSYVPPHSSSSGGTVIAFCHFRASSSGSGTPFPDVNGLQYGVFAPASLPGAISTGFVTTDDEDNQNQNHLSGSSAGSETWLTTGSSWTTLRLARVR